MTLIQISCTFVIRYVALDVVGVVVGVLVVLVGVVIVVLIITPLTRCVLKALINDT